MNRIAVVFQSFVRAGSQRHLVEILKGIRLYRPDVEVCLFLIAAPNASWGTFLPEVQQAGIPVILSPYVYRRWDSANLAARAHDWASRHFRERQLNDDFYRQLHRFDTVVCTEFFVADLLFHHLQKRQRLCFHLMEHLAQRSNSDHYRLLRHPRLHVVFMHSSQIAQLPVRLPLESTITWPVRLCPDHFQTTSPQASALGEPLRIAHYSRISPMRLIDQLIDAFALLHRRTAATLRIAGHIEDPDYHRGLLNQIALLGLTGSVQFVEPVPSPAEDPAISDVDLVWMISLSGHIGYAGIEAMAAGLPSLLLEVDSHASEAPPDPALGCVICHSADHLVERSMALQTHPDLFLQEQGELVRRQFMTTVEGINSLVSYYLPAA